jgi:hypothetical protein
MVLCVVGEGLPAPKGRECTPDVRTPSQEEEHAHATSGLCRPAELREEFREVQRLFWRDLSRPSRHHGLAGTYTLHWRTTTSLPESMQGYSVNRRGRDSARWLQEARACARPEG